MSSKELNYQGITAVAITIKNEKESKAAKDKYQSGRSLPVAQANGSTAHQAFPCIRGSRGLSSQSPPIKPTKVTLFTIIFYNSENSIRYIKPFGRPLFCHSSDAKYNSSPFCNEAVMRLDCQCY